MVRDYTMIEKTYDLTIGIQKDQISELKRVLDKDKEMSYNRGFNDGKTHALICSIEDRGILDYAEGYHAAIKQLGNQNLEQNKTKK